MEEQKLLKKEARWNISKVGFYYAFSYVIILIVSALIGRILTALGVKELDPNLELVIMSVVPMYLVAFPAIYIALKKTVPEVKPEKNKMTVGQYITTCITCIGLAYISNFIGLIITGIIGLVRGQMVDNTILDVATNVSPLTVLIYMVIMAPIMEEFMFRKLIVDHTVQYSKAVAILLSGLMFGLFHANLNQFIYAFVIGCYFAFVYVKTGDIKITISMHMIFNFMGGFVATNLLNELHIDEYMEAATGSDPTAAFRVIMEHPIPWIIYGFFFLYIIGMIIAGFVLLIVGIVKGNYKLVEDSPKALPKGNRITTAIFNPGMLFYIGFFLLLILLQLLGLAK